ncbi:MAG: hypothetical protein CVT49_09815 [candidate division Zixibacteria bacterium HGW-Zixibacteria-1]|nr:MAG: hypothetical protein CVT49_09815 [candidate division Zixibacteria bacterium HGW-Zixibacteria-1]
MANIQKPGKTLWVALAVIIMGMILLRIPPVDGFWTMNIAPILLVLGYVILAPIGLLPRKAPPGSYYDSPEAAGGLRYLHYGAASVFVAAFIVYLITLWPGPGWWDSADYIICCYNLGIPSPPGSFLLELIGRTAATLVPVFSPHTTINLLMALFTAIAAAVVYYITVRIIRSFGNNEPSSNSAAMFAGIMAALTLALTHSVWCKATFANAYTLSLLTGGILIYLVILWWEKADVSGGGNYLLLAAFILGLDLSVHRSNLLLVPFFIVLILIRRPRAFLDWKLWLGSILVFLLGISMQFGLMFRAQLNPEINFGNPDNLTSLWDYVNLRQFDISIFGLDLLERKGPFWSYQVKEMYLRYIGWNFIGLGSDGARVGFSGMYGIPLLFGAIGLIVHFARRFKQALMFFVAFLFASFGAIFYLNVPAGFFREMDRHFVVSFMIIAVWVGIAVYVALYYLPRLLSRSRRYTKIAFAIMVIVAFLILPLNMFRANFHNNDMHDNYTADSFGRNLLESCEPNAILITAGDSDTFTAWYARMIEKIRPDITTINIHLLNTPWYLNTLMTYHPDIPWSLTKDSITALSPRIWDGDSIHVAASGNYEASFSFLPQPSFGEYLIVSDQVVIDIIRTNKWKRPICFSLGFGENVPLGLREYCRLDGLVWRLCPDSISREDVGRLEENIWKYDYRGYGDYKYLDRTTENMGRNYWFGFAGLANHYRKVNDEERMGALKDILRHHWPIEGLPEMLFGTPGNDSGPD